MTKATKPKQPKFDISPVGKTGRPRSAETITLLRLVAKIEWQFQQPFITQQPVYVDLLSDSSPYMNFVLPMPPSLNRWTRTFKGVAHASPAATRYKELAAELLTKAGITPQDGLMETKIVLRGLPSNSDIDSRQKQLFDCLQGVAIFDDKQFRRMEVLVESMQGFWRRYGYEKVIEPEPFPYVITIIRGLTKEEEEKCR